MTYSIHVSISYSYHRLVFKLECEVIARTSATKTFLTTAWLLLYFGSVHDYLGWSIQRIDTLHCSKT